MMFQIEMSSAPKKPSRPTRVPSAIWVATPISASDAAQRRLIFPPHLHRLVGLGDMLDQQLLLLGRADDLRAVVALELVHQPGADRIHPLDLGEVDGQAVAIDLLQLLG